MSTDPQKYQEKRTRDLRNKMVYKANELIQKSRFDLSLQQQKIVLYLIGQISPYDDDFKEYTFNIGDFCRVCGIDYTSGKNYSALKEAIKEITDKSLWIRLDDNRETLVRWIEKPTIHKSAGTISIRLDKDMKPYLLKLKENFTVYELIYTLYFKSKYTIRLYELIKSVHYHDLEEHIHTFTVEELKRACGGESYAEYRDFKRRVLDTAVNEINQFSDKDLEYTEIRSGRKVISVQFRIRTKESTRLWRIAASVEKELEKTTSLQ